MIVNKADGEKKRKCRETLKNPCSTPPKGSAIYFSEVFFQQVTQEGWYTNRYQTLQFEAPATTPV